VPSAVVEPGPSLRLQSLPNWTPEGMAYVPDLVTFFVKYNIAPNRLAEVSDKADEYAETFPIASQPYMWWKRFAEELRLMVPNEDLTILLRELGD
jgi:hypothetical protein